MFFFNDAIEILKYAKLLSPRYRWIWLPHLISGKLWSGDFM